MGMLSEENGEDNSDVEDDANEVNGGDSSDSSDTTIRRSRTLSPPCSSAFGNAAAPEGYKLLEHCPALESDADLSNFVDKLVLVGHDSRQARGWFVGRVHSLVLSSPFGCGSAARPRAQMW